MTAEQLHFLSMQLYAQAEKRGVAAQEHAGSPAFASLHTAQLVIGSIAVAVGELSAAVRKQECT